MARLSFRCDDEMLAAVDRARGDVPREVWLRRAVEARLGAELGVEAPQPSVRAPAEQSREIWGLPVHVDERVPRGKIGVVPSGHHAPTCKCPVCS